MSQEMETAMRRLRAFMFENVYRNKVAKSKNATTYTLQVKGEISSSTVRRLKANESVSTNTLDALCRILDCELDDIIAYLPDETE